MGTRVFLVEPYYIDVSKHKGTINVPMEPIGLCYISSVLKAAGHEVKILQQGPLSDEKVLKRIEEFQPTVVGFSTITHNFHQGLTLARAVKKRIGSTIIFGGVHPSTMPEVVQDEAIDFAVIGEGERTMTELLEHLVEGNDAFEEISGIAYWDGTLKKTAPRERILNLDALPFPDRSDLPMSSYRDYVVGSFMERKASVLGSRGCNSDCSFCTSPYIWKRRWVTRSVGNILDEVESLLKDYGAQFIFFRDDDFLVSSKRVKALCNEIIERDLQFHWFCMGKTTEVDKDILLRMREAGCVRIDYGLERFDDESLAAINKKTTMQSNMDAVEWTNQVGIFLTGNFILGFPDDTREKLQRFARFILPLNLDFISVQFATPFPKTRLREELIRNEIPFNTEISRYDPDRPVIHLADITFDELIRLRRSIIWRYYFSLRYMKRVIKRVIKSPGIFKSYVMALFFGLRKGYFT